MGVPHLRFEAQRGAEPMRTMLLIGSIGAFVVLTAGVLLSVGLSGSALVTANDSLGVVDSELTSVGGHADPLTFQVQKVNSTLTQVEGDLNPLHNQATNLNGILGGVNDTLTSANGSVSSILGHAGPIETTLTDAESHLAQEARQVGDGGGATTKVDSLSTFASTLLGILQPVEADLHAVSGQLSTTNDHLNSACNQIPPQGGC